MIEKYISIKEASSLFGVTHYIKKVGEKRSFSPTS